MISQLASPTVVVIDDEKRDYDPILACLNGMFVSCVHLRGELEELPPQPFDRVRLVFLDLHLSGSIGKEAASYTANYFRKTIATDSAPVVVVIWSKYAADKIGTGDAPADQDTEAELFKKTLLEAEHKFEGRLIFVEMSKPKPDDRPAEWSGHLRTEIDTALGNQPAIDALWAWDRLVKDASAKVSQEMTLVAQAAVPSGKRDLKEGLKATMQRLAKAESVGDFTAETAPRYLVTVLAQLLADQLEHPDNLAGISAHGSWLCQDPPGVVPETFPGMTNGVLLTSGVSESAGTFAPGTVYGIDSNAAFRCLFGKDTVNLLELWISQDSPNFSAFRTSAKPVLIELSPVCDLAQGKRINALLVAGFVAPVALDKVKKKSGEAFGYVQEKFYLRWPLGNVQAGEVWVHYCHLFKATLPAATLPAYLTPWFRIRDLPLAAIRNANAAHGARVGYVTL